MKAIHQHRFGGPEELRLEELPEPQPGAGEVRIRVAAAGVHLIDTKIRAGEAAGPFPLPELPMTPGREVAGVVDAVGAGVGQEWIGRRVVAHLGQASGGYAEFAVRALEAVHVLPDATDFDAAVAMIGTGRTAMGILELSDLRAGDVVLVPAAAGGLGSLLVQAARAAGATVVGAAGGPEKVARVRALGAHVAVDYAERDWPEAVRSALAAGSATPAEEPAVSLVLDGVGGAVGRAAFELLAPRGRHVLFGWSSGAPTQIETRDLIERGVTATAALGAVIMRRPGRLRELEEQALAALAEGHLRPLVNPPFALAEAAAAHAALESRATVGKVVLRP